MPDVNVDINDRRIYGVLAKVALPIAAQGVISAILGLVDTLMVGFLGELPLAAVGLAMQIFFIHYLFLFGFVGGTATFMAQYYGQRDYSAIRKTVGFAIGVAMVVGSIFFLIGFFFPEKFLDIYSDDVQVKELAAKYMRIGSFTFFTLAISSPLEMALKSSQQTKIPLFVSGTAFTLNTFLNYVLIFGKFGAPAMGVEGAALATVIARFVEALLSYLYCSSKRNIFFGSFKSYWGWKKNFILSVLRNALPTTINEFLWSLGQTMYVAAYARLGTTQYAAYQVAGSINGIFLFCAFSLGDGALILIGEKLGQGKFDAAYIMAKKILKIGIVFCILVGIVLIAVSVPLLSLFKLSEEGKTYAFYILLVYGLTLVIGQYNGMFTTGILRSGGDTKFAMLTECLTVWLLGVPTAFIVTMIFGFPIYLALLSVKAVDLVESLIFTKRLVGRKWINRVIVDA